MKIKTFKINVLLEFESVQPANVEANVLRTIIAEGMKQSIPKGCRIADVQVKEISKGEKDIKEIANDLKSEISSLAKAERENIVDGIVNSGQTSEKILKPNK